jgi:hypothetical protein
MRSKWFVAAALSAVLAFPALATAGGAKGKTFFTAVLNGGQVIPPSTSNALGVAFLTFDNATKRLCYAISYTGLEGIETEAHIHDGAPGETDAVFFDLTPLGSPKLGCVGPLKATEEHALRRGRTYINIHTDVWVAGELRGQVLQMRGGQ